MFCKGLITPVIPKQKWINLILVTGKKNLAIVAIVAFLF